ncbi:hypothetical protein R1flu_014365 [Riccia fluitans]|uniref:S-acyltransferase n=1 Tax=Riccia fluitans TaxID=41844 RepID=A0ABD1YJA3_9MARC
MVRRHGWQLPAHTFQVVAITVFFLLAVAFYVFLAPFLWFHALEYVALALYSPLAFGVFLLYVRSSAIDPADPGVFASQPMSKNTRKGSFSDASLGMTPSDTLRPLSPGLSTPSRSSSVMPSDSHFDRKTPYGDQPRLGWRKRRNPFSFSAICCLCCGWVVKDDSCRDDFKLQQPVAEEDVLFCTLCNAEVRKFSKHCRSCDKCVDGFDHHCRWLNNCVGRKNYNTFVALMATSLSLLVLEWGVGIAVLVRSFVDKRGIEHQIVDKLGNGFSRAPFATVVAICTLVSLLASIPLGELFFFHLILIRKGITTYEYVVAMRAQNEPQGLSIEGEPHSIPTSPSSSTATGLSGSSSLGLQYSRGAWCTPPRVFVEHQDEVVPHLGPGRVPSTIDPDAGNAANKNENRPNKGAVRISAWKLAKLNPDDASRAAAKARENSSILRQLGPRDYGIPEGEYTSSSNMSSRSTMSADYLNSKRRIRDDSSLGSVKVDIPGIGTTRDDSSVHYEPAGVGQRSKSSGSSPSHPLTDSTTLSPLPAERRFGPSSSTSGMQMSAPSTRGSEEAGAPVVMVGASRVRTHVPSSHAAALSHSSADISRAWSHPAASSDGYEASSGGESADDAALPRINQYPSKGRVNPDHVTISVKEGKQAAFYWDRASRSYDPSNARIRGDGGDYTGTSSASAYTENSRRSWPEPSATPSSLSDDLISSELGPGRFSPLHTFSPSQTSTSATNASTKPPIIGKVSPQQNFSSLPPKPPSEPKAAPKPLLPPENRAPRSAIRSQSPVFAPRTMLSFSPLGPGERSGRQEVVSVSVEIDITRWVLRAPWRWTIR